MPSVNLAALIAQLRECQLVEPAQLDEIAGNPAGRGEDPMPLARLMVQAGWLTPYQLNLVLAGRGKELLIGPYRLLDRLGEGGMGQVFKALHPTMGRVVALKVIRKEKLANPQAVRRFQQEVQAAAKLVSPNVVVAFDAGQANDTHYFAMEYIEGIDLSKLVKTNGPLPVVDACDFVKQAALGLQHAHERGMVHRDIKPGNLLLSKVPGAPAGGIVKILDMGLARLNDADPGNALTRIGAVVGTPEFLAPEQAKNSHVDIRADIYSLGCTLFYLLAGRTPFKANTVNDILMKHQVELPPALDQVRPDAPPQLGLVLKRMLAKKPEERYQTPADVVLALSPFARQTGPRSAPVVPSPAAIVPAAVSPAPPSRPKPAAAPTFANLDDDSSFRRRRSRGSGLLVKLTALVLLLGAIGGAALAFRPQIEKFLTEKVPVTDRVAQAGKDSTATEPPATNPEPEPEPKTAPPEATTTPPPPEPKTEPKPEPKDEPKPAAEPKIGPKAQPKAEPKKPAVPPDDKLAAAEKTVRETYKAEYARKKNEDLIALAGKLLKDAAGTKDDLVTRFVLLREARDLGTMAGHAESILTAIDEMDATWAIKALEMKITALETATRDSHVPPVMRSLAEAALKVAEDAVEADKYDAGRRLMAAARAAARKGNNVALLTKVQNKDTEVAEIAKEYEATRSAREKLAKGPDEESNFKWGRFLAYFKGHWGDGLPLLASGSDDKVLMLAQKDQTNPKDPADQVAVGDGWYDLGQDEKSQVGKKNLWLRAKYWYDQALPGLSGFNKIKVDKRLKEIAALLPKEETTPTTTATATPPPTTPRGQFEAMYQTGQSQYRSGRYTDAADSFKKAIAIAPDNSSTSRATSALKQANYADAMARGTALATQGKYKEASDAFYQALEEAPNDPTASKYLAWVNNALAGNTNPNNPFGRGKGKGR